MLAELSKKDETCKAGELRMLRVFCLLFLLVPSSLPSPSSACVISLPSFKKV